MGDLNAHNPQWASDKITDKGRKIEDVILHLNLCILNDGSNTYLHVLLAMVLAPQLIILLYHYS